MISKKNLGSVTFFRARIGSRLQTFAVIESGKTMGESKSLRNHGSGAEKNS
jgi:hypothetical protein